MMDCLETVGRGGIMVPLSFVRVLLCTGESKRRVSATDGLVYDSSESLPATYVLVLAPRSNTASFHNHACHGHTHPSSSHGHLSVSIKSSNARTPRTRDVAHKKPMIALERFSGHRMEPGCCHSESPVKMMKMRKP
jgi:hypothetical protein